MRTAVLVCVAILVVAEATLASTVTPGNSITVNMAGGTSVKVSVPSDGVNSVEVNPSGGQPPTHVDIVVNGSGGKVKVEVDEEDDAEIPRDELKIHVIVNGDNNEIRIEGGTRTGDAETTLTYTNSSSAGADGNTTYLGACKPEGETGVAANGWKIEHQGSANVHADNNKTKIGTDDSAATVDVPCAGNNVHFGPSTTNNRSYEGQGGSSNGSQNDGAKSNVHYDQNGGPHR
jgi:FlaG/FlaF family flagellin (archaellin)